MINQEIASSIALVDMAVEKLEGEARDLKQGAAFHSRTEILSSSGYEITSNSRLVIITAGCARKPGEARLNLMQRNVGVMKSIIPQVLEYSPNAAICVISNPCDIMTAVSMRQDYETFMVLWLALTPLLSVSLSKHVGCSKSCWSQCTTWTHFRKWNVPRFIPSSLSCSSGSWH